jgi:hypothetical protein
MWSSTYSAAIGPPRYAVGMLARPAPTRTAVVLAGAVRPMVLRHTPHPAGP